MINGSEVHCKEEHQFDERQVLQPTTRRSEDMENENLEGTQIAVAGEALQSIVVDGFAATSCFPFL